jgi:hypothetical protein
MGNPRFTVSGHQKLTIFMHGLYFAGTSMAH